MSAQSIRTYDAIIVGGRCAGAATALQLARAGLDVLVLDRQDYGVDTLSTHALMRGAVIQLHRWGLLDAIVAGGTPPIGVTSFHYGDDELVISMKARDGIGALYAPRRTVLDRLLVDAARGAGAEIRHGNTVVGLLRRDDGRVGGVSIKAPSGKTSEIRADLVIGADGRRSTVARLLDAAIYRPGRHATATVYGYFTGLDRDRYRWYYGSGVAASLIPTNDAAACVAISIPADGYQRIIRADVEAGFRRVLRTVSPELAVAAAPSRRVGPLRAFAGATGFMRRSVGPGWALVGDAAHFKDPLTAHGITDALRDSELLARAVVKSSADGWRRYEAERDALSMDLFAITDEIASFAWDLNGVRLLHRQLNDEMKREVAAIVAFDSGGGRLAA